MSKMGQELDKRLDENKYAMYEVLTWAWEDLLSTKELKVSTRSKIWQVLNKIEGKDETV